MGRELDAGRRLSLPLFRVPYCRLRDSGRGLDISKSCHERHRFERRRLESEREIEGLGLRRNGVKQNPANADQVSGLNNACCSVAHQGASEAVLLEASFNRESPQHGDRHRVSHVAAQTSRSSFDSDRAGGKA